MEDNNPKMMPGQKPYSPEELEKLYSLVSDAAVQDPGEYFEDFLLEDSL